MPNAAIIVSMWTYLISIQDTHVHPWSTPIWSLQTLSDYWKAFYSSVLTVLESGAFCQLRFLLSYIQYATLLQIPFERRVYLQSQASLLSHGTHIWGFKECVGLLQRRAIYLLRKNNHLVSKKSRNPISSLIYSATMY